MKEFKWCKFNINILGKKNLLIFLSILVAFLTFILIENKNIFLKDLFFYSDVILPIFFGVIGFIIFQEDMCNDVNDLVLIYNKKNYNKVLFIRIIEYIAVVTVVYGVTLFLLSSKLHIEFSIKHNSLGNYSFLAVFIRSYINLIFIIVSSLFFLKISKNIITTLGTFGVYIFQELAGEGTYTYPFNLFINYSERTNVTLEFFVFNRGVILLISIIMILYIMIDCQVKCNTSSKKA